MRFLVVGLNHRTAPLQIREQLAVTTEQLPEAIKEMRLYLKHGVILSTCNRMEVYTVCDEELDGNIKMFMTNHFGVTIKELEPYLYIYWQEESVRHLLRVASGLDSMILGETQILGQVRNAFNASTKAGVTQGPLSRLFHHAIRTGRRTRKETDISRNSLSVSQACVQLVHDVLGELSLLNVMVIGAGEVGNLAAKALGYSGVRNIVVTSRTFQHAKELGKELVARVIPFSDMPSELSKVDIVIGSTGSPEYIISKNMVVDAMRKRLTKPMFLMDIAIPRDIDPAVKELDGIFLRDIDDLEHVSEANRLERQQSAELAQDIIEEEVASFLKWFRVLEVVPLISSIRDKAERVRNKELSKTLKKLGKDVTLEQQERLDTMTRAIVNKLLHEPITYLREQRSPSHLQLARELFNIKEREEGV